MTLPKNKKCRKTVFPPFDIFTILSNSKTQISFLFPIAFHIQNRSRYGNKLNIKLQTWLHTGAGAMYSKTECPIVIHIDLNGCFAPLFKSHGTYLHRRAGIRNFKSRCFLPTGSAQCAMQIECMNGSRFLAVVADDLMIIFHPHQILKHSDGNFRLPFINPVYLIQKSFQQRNVDIPFFIMQL